MYQIVISLYLIGVAIASLFSKKVKTMWRGERRAISDIRAKVDPEARYIWVHAASLGEFEQGRPIIERIRAEHPEYKILLTFFSPSGYEVRKNYDGADIITYLPIDTLRNARRFLNAIHPVCALFIKYEFWYNYLHILKKRGVPVYSVSSIFRPDQIFFKGYGRQYSRVLRCFTHFFVQNAGSRRLLADKLGLFNVTITGDTRFDRVLTIAQQAKEIPVVEQFLKRNSGKRIFIAGSSWQPDEEIFIPYFKDKHDWALIIAPHVIGEEHLQQIEALLKANGRTPLRFTEASGKTSDGERQGTEDSMSAAASADALIINCFGLLSSIYRYADVTYVGGGFGVSIHNLPEAAVWSKPVIFGPENRKFQEAQDLKACGGGIEISGSEVFAETMDRFIADDDALATAAKAAGDYVRSKAGATDTILKAIHL